jgi:hypothetical protein
MVFHPLKHGTNEESSLRSAFTFAQSFPLRRLLSDVYESVRSGECPLGLIPQENSIHGIVIEAYDILRVPDFGREAFVRGEITINIQHCLITRKGVALENVRRILSHEQVSAGFGCVRTKLTRCVYSNACFTLSVRSLLFYMCQTPLHTTFPFGAVSIDPPVPVACLYGIVRVTGWRQSRGFASNLSRLFFFFGTNVVTPLPAALSILLHRRLVSAANSSGVI